MAWLTLAVASIACRSNTVIVRRGTPLQHGPLLLQSVRFYSSDSMPVD